MDITKIRFYQLHKQNLLTKAHASDYSRLLRVHIALHSTDNLTPYLSLWARVKDFDPKALFDDLNDPFNALRMRAFRGTVFVIHRENLKYLLGASKIYLANIIKENEKFLSKSGVNLAAIEQEVVGLLSNKKELSANELKKELPDNLKGEYLSYALRFLEFSGVLVRMNHRYIGDRLIKYGLMTEWFPEILDFKIDPDEALMTLIFKYIKQFGPICLDDLSWWLSITKTAARQVIEALKENLVSIDFNGREYYVEKDDHQDFDNFKFNSDETVIINFLAYEDHFPKAYFVRNWFLPDNVAPIVYKEGVIFRGQIFPSIWRNGEIIGGWAMEWMNKTKSKMKVEVTNIHEQQKLSRDIMQLIESQRTELENFINEKLVPLMNTSKTKK